MFYGILIYDCFRIIFLTVLLLAEMPSSKSCPEEINKWGTGYLAGGLLVSGVSAILCYIPIREQRRRGEQLYSCKWLKIYIPAVLLEMFFIAFFIYGVHIGVYSMTKSLPSAPKKCWIALRATAPAFLGFGVGIIMCSLLYIPLMCVVPRSSSQIPPF